MSRLDRLVAELASRPPVVTDDPALRQAAVAVLLAPDPDQLLVIRRTERTGDPWSGHLALPGGRREPGDADLLHTAIRETAEETGVNLERTWCRATLDDLAPHTAVLPAIVVRPFVFRLPSRVDAGSSSEVAVAQWVPLEWLAQPGIFRSLAVESRGQRFTAQGYQLDHGFLWGMTERMVTPIVRSWMALGED
ncbi:MAG: CoA pyrophosphatase [Gemmatimonadales bacterium]